MTSVGPVGPSPIADDASSRAAGQDTIVRVLHSLRPPDGTTKYVDQIVDGKHPNVRISYFSWKTALVGSYDVLHVHWPELLVRDRSKLKGFLKRRMLDVLIARLALKRIPLVWTAHNVEPHETWSKAELRAVQKFTRAVDLAIALNATTVVPASMDMVTILHGHYRDRFAPLPQPDSEPGRILYFGIIRPYKGVESLIAAFAEVGTEDASLRIVGNPHPGYREIVEAAEAADDRVGARLEFVADDVLVDEVRRAQLVVLPYREKMHNSGSLLVALSLQRPVLVPSSPTNQAISKEVGPGWVIQYDGDLDAATIESALETAARTIAESDGPHLEGRDWDFVGAEHYRAYLSAIADRRGRS